MKKLIPESSRRSELSFEAEPGEVRRKTGRGTLGSQARNGQHINNTQHSERNVILNDNK